MATKKVTFVFEGSQCGWTESYYIETAESHETIYLKGKDLAIPRARLLGQEASIKAIRVSSEGVKNDGLLKYEKDLKGVAQETCAQKDVALMVRCENDNHTAWRNMYLRGIWDRVEDEQGKYQGRKIKKWADAFDAFALVLRNDGWSWIHQIRAEIGKVTALTATVGDRLVYTLDRQAFLQGDVDELQHYHIRFAGINGKSTANGLKVVEVIARDQLRTVHPLAAGAYRFGGTASKYTPLPMDIAVAHDAKIVTRETGAPLLESVGRAPARPRA